VRVRKIQPLEREASPHAGRRPSTGGSGGVKTIAIAAFVGLLALVLLSTWKWFESTPRAREPIAGNRSHGEGGRRDGHQGADTWPEPGSPAAREGDERVVGGSLIDDESGPLADGRVDLWCDDGRLGARMQVDADGNFVGPACSGRTCARLVHPAFEQPEAWELEPGVMRSLAVAPAPGIAGTVVGAADEPIADANLLLRRGPQRAAARCDADGTFALALPRERPCDACDRERDEGCRAGDPQTAGSATLLVWAPGHAPREIEVSLLPQAELRVVLSAPAPALEGRIVGPDGTPIGLRTMVLATNREREVEQHAAVVQADGSFSFADLADADYRIRAIRDGQVVAVLDCSAPGDRVELRVERAMHGRDLHIEVRDDADHPTPGARIDGGPFRGAKTDGSGRVEVQEVLPGAYTLSVRAPGCPVVRTSVKIDPEADTPVHQLVRLPAGCVTSD
jgi:hypothetical protein